MDANDIERAVEAANAKTKEEAAITKAEETEAAIAKAVRQALIDERYKRFLEERDLIKIHAKKSYFAASCRSWYHTRMY
jgi:hypothetical protein